MPIDPSATKISPDPSTAMPVGPFKRIVVATASLKMVSVPLPPIIGLDLALGHLADAAVTEIGDIQIAAIIRRDIRRQKHRRRRRRAAIARKRRESRARHRLNDPARNHAHAIVERVGDVDRPGRIAPPRPPPDSARPTVAGPPSPLYPADPLPAKVVITPLFETLRTTLFPESAI